MSNKKNDENVYAVSEAIEALLTALEELGIEFKRESVKYGYERDEGQYVYVISEGIPDFMIGEDMLAFSSFEWLVLRIKPYSNTGNYIITFLLEDMI